MGTRRAVSARIFMKCVRNFAQLVSVSLKMIIATTLNDFLRQFSDNINLASNTLRAGHAAKRVTPEFFLAAAAPALQLYIFCKLTGRVEIILNNFMVGARRPADQTRSHEFIKSDAICKYKQLPSNGNWELTSICIYTKYASTRRWTKSGGNFWIKGAYKFEIWIRRSAVRWVVWWLNIQISGPRCSLVREIQPGESRVGRNTHAA